MADFVVRELSAMIQPYHEQASQCCFPPTSTIVNSPSSL